MVARDFVTRHRVKNIVLNGYEAEPNQPHPHFPFVAGMADSLRHFYARRIFDPAVWNMEGGFKEPLSFVASNLLRQGIRIWLQLPALLDDSPGETALYEHFRGSKPLGQYPPPRDAWHASQEKYAAPPRDMAFDPYARKGGFENTLWRDELRRLAEVCRERGTRLVILFAHPRMNEKPSEKYLRYYREELGADVVLMPREVLVDPDLWRDAGHLNVEGCRRFTEAFIRQEKARAANATATEG